MGFELFITGLIGLLIAALLIFFLTIRGKSRPSDRGTEQNSQGKHQS